MLFIEANYFQKDLIDHISKIYKCNCVTKGCLISYFFHYGTNLQKWVPNHNPEHYLPKENTSGSWFGTHFWISISENLHNYWYSRKFPPARLLIFQKFSPCTSILSCTFNVFLRIFPPARLFHPTRLFGILEYAWKMSTTHFPPK